MPSLRTSPITVTVRGRVTTHRVKGHRMAQESELAFVGRVCGQDLVQMADEIRTADGRILKSRAGRATGAP